MSCWIHRLRRPGVIRLMVWMVWALASVGLVAASDTGSPSENALPSEPPRLTGSVMSALGEPLEGARVQLLPLQSNYHRLAAAIGPHVDAASAPVSEAKTDAAGRFELHAPRVSLWRLEVEAPGHVAMQQMLLPLVENRHLAPVALPLDDPITVVCLDDTGQPLDDVLIFAFGPPARWQDQGGWSVADRFVRSDAEGRAVVARRYTETLSLTARVAGTLTIRDRRVEATSRKVEWRFPKATGKRAVQVSEASREPVGEVVVGLGDLAMPVAKTDLDGRVMLRGEPREDVTWHLFTRDGRQLRHRAHPSAAPLFRLDTLQLPTRRPLSGRVVEAGTRRPLGGLLVWPGNDPGRAVRTDAQGRFEFSSYGKESPWIQAQGMGYLPQLQRVQTDGADWVSPLLSLTPTTRLEGRVTDREGRPLAAVALTLTTASPQEFPPAFRPDGALHRAVSDAEGRFTLASLHPRAGHHVRAELSGFVTAVISVVDAATRQEPLLLQLVTARAAFGRVVDGDERPVSEAKVVLADAAGPRTLEPVLTGADGRFQVSELPSHRVDLEVSKKGYPPVQVRAVEVPRGDGPADLGVILLRRGLSLAGRVVDAEGRPIDGALLTALPAPEDSQKSLANRRLAERPVRSDLEGHFRLEGLLSSQRIFLVVEHPDYVQRALEGVDLPSDDLYIVLQRGARVAGRVEDEEGQPLSGATVLVRGAPRPAGTVGVLQASDENDFETRSDDQGLFEVQGVIPGALKVQAFLEGYQPAEPRLLEIRLDEPAQGLVLVLRRGLTLAGTVQNADAEPVDGAVLTLAHVRGRSDADGAFLLAGLPEGRHELEVRHPAYNWQRQDVEVEESSPLLQVVLRGGGGVEGRVLDAAGLPLSEAQVRFDKQARRDRHRYQTNSDADGRFELDGMALGSYQVTATRTGYGPTRLSDEVTVDGAVEGIEIVLRPGVEIVGRVKGLDFEALAAVEVEADDGRGGLYPAVVDYEGNYRVGDLAPGVWTVRGRLEGGRRQVEARLAIAEGERRGHRDLEFGGGLTLEGQVLLGGEPLPRTWVALRGTSEEIERNVTSDFRGRFRFADLIAGAYRLSLSNSREMLVHNEEIELVQDRNLVLDLAATEVRGRVADDEGQGIHEARVRLQQMHGQGFEEPGSMIMVATDTSGRFHLARVSAGTYTLQVEKPGRAPWRQPLEVTAGESIGPLDIVLEATEGLELEVRCGGGRIPAWVDLSLFDGSGRHLVSHRRSVEGTGRAQFETVPAGTWSAQIGAQGCAPGERALIVPGDPQEVLLSGEGRLRVQVVALAESARRAEVTLRNADGQPFGQAAGDGRWVTSWPLVRGQAQLQGLPAGSWRVEVTAADGQSWRGELTVAEGGTTSLTL